MLGPFLWAHGPVPLPLPPTYLSHFPLGSYPPTPIPPPQMLLTSVLTSKTDLKSLDMEASFDWKRKRKRQQTKTRPSCLSSPRLPPSGLTCRETTMVLEWVCRCRPLWLPLALTKSWSWAICLLRLLISW